MITKCPNCGRDALDYEDTDLQCRNCGWKLNPEHDDMREHAEFLVETLSPNAKCRRCKGAGQVFPGPNTCPDCNGDGKRRLPPIQDIVKAYKGKSGACCCGCSGTYYYAKAHQVLGGQQRGYAVDDDEIDDAGLARVYDVVAKAIEADDPELDYGDSYIAVDIGKKAYIVYTDR